MRNIQIGWTIDREMDRSLYSLWIDSKVVEIFSEEELFKLLSELERELGIRCT